MDLLNVLTSGTLAKLGKGNNIRMGMLDKICSFLDCQPGDIMEYVEEEEKL